MTNLGSKYGMMDQTTLKKVQELLAFVDFVAGLEETSAEHKIKAEEVKHLIKHLDKPETFRQWNVCIDIYDPVIQCGNLGPNGGIYWKDWSIWFESGLLEIRIQENRVDKDGYPNEELIFYSAVNFNRAFKGQRVWGNKNYSHFITNARSFREDISGNFKAVETEIDLWD